MKLVIEEDDQYGLFIREARDEHPVVTVVEIPDELAKAYLEAKQLEHDRRQAILDYAESELGLDLDEL